MRFGIDRTDITPDYWTYMAGYGARNDLSDGVNDPLTFTSLIIEEKGKKVFIGAVDLVGIGHEHSKKIRQKIADMLGINFSDVMINCSHTHGGMRVKGSDYMDSSKKFAAIVNKNKRLLERRVYASVKKAAEKMQNGKIYYGEGVTSIPMNRRRLYEGKIDNRPNPKGKTDSALKVLKITDSKGKAAAVIVRVSCHPVATGAKHLLTADFPGALRPLLDKCFPGAIAVFWQGVGADARPRQAANGDRWRALYHNELPAIGECLLGEVMAVLTNKMVPIENIRLGSAVKVVELPIAKIDVTKEDLKKMLIEARSDISRFCIRKMLAQKKLATGLPITVQMISLGKEFSIAGIEGEVLCGLGERVEQKITSKFKMMMGYTNGARAYLPDKEEMKRGGYEADTVLDLLPAPFSPRLEDIFMETVAEFDKKLNR